MTVRVKDTMTASLNKIQRQLDQLPAQAYKEWVKTTPKRSGNARRKTRLAGEKIRADYAYAERLDKGWSQQAPDGMSDPVSQFIAKYIERLGR